MLWRNTLPAAAPIRAKVWSTSTLRECPKVWWSSSAISYTARYHGPRGGSSRSPWPRRRSGVGAQSDEADRCVATVHASMDSKAKVPSPSNRERCARPTPNQASPTASPCKNWLPAVVSPSSSAPRRIRCRSL